MELIIPISDRLRPLTAGTAKRSLRLPGPNMVEEVRASLDTAQATGAPVQIDIKKAGLSILATPLEIANGQTSTVGGAAVVALGGVYIPDDEKLTFDVLQVGEGSKGLDVILIGRRAFSVPVPPEVPPEDPPPDPPGDPIDRSTSAQAIGSALAIGAVGDVYDKNPATRTFSNETYTGVNGASWSGQDFGAGNAKALAHISFLQGRDTGFDANECVTSVKVQFADGSGGWTDQQTFAVTQTHTAQTLTLTGAPVKQRWRVLANSGVANGYRWVLSEIGMWA